MPAPANPRIAILGFSIECNKFAPPATKAHFLARTYLEGDDIITEARGATPTMLPETPGFVAAMDAAGPWQPVGIALAMSEPNGPVEHAFFEELLATIARRLNAALPLDGVYICAHGAALTDRGGRPRGRPLRDRARYRRRRGAGRRELRSARQCLRPHGPADRRLYRLPHQPASRHARARRRGGRGIARIARRHQDRAGAPAPADRAADRDAADRRRPLCRDDRARPAPPGTTAPGDHERLGDGRVCLFRHRQERAQRHRDRARRPASGRGARPRDRALWLGQSRALLSAADPTRRSR